MKKTRQKNREAVVSAIRLTWASLDSHLDYTIRPATKLERKTASGSRKFHICTCKEYLQVLTTLLNQL